MKLKATFYVVLLTHMSLVHAEPEGVPVPPAPTFGEMLEESGVIPTGFIDTSYTYLSGAGVFTSGIPNCVFERERNSFNLQVENIVAAYQPEEGFGGFAQLDFGSDANVFAPVGTDAEDKFDVQEIFIQYAAGPAQ
jgi:hypothetical protein